MEQTRLKEALIKRGMTQQELCKRTGIKKSAMSQYVNGTIKPAQDKLYVLAQALNVSIPWLMGLDSPIIDAHMIESLSPEKQDLINKIMQMSDDQVKALANVLSLMNL